MKIGDRVRVVSLNSLDQEDIELNDYHIGDEFEISDEFEGQVQYLGSVCGIHISDLELVE